MISWMKAIQSLVLTFRYLMDNNSFDGPMPPLDISDKYGLDLGEEEE